MKLATYFNEKIALTHQRQLVIVGAAVVDIVAKAEQLPIRGGDLAIKPQGIHIGGSALNIAIALHRLGLPTTNVIPLGKGVWSDIIKSQLSAEGIISSLPQQPIDNGWSLALVEPNGERTFLSASGAGERWESEQLVNLVIDNDALIYICGYQLCSHGGDILVNWLVTLAPSVQIIVDFGPRLADIPFCLIERLLTLNTLFTLNRQEAYYLQKNWLAIQTETLAIPQMNKRWFEKYQTPLIIRVDHEGAYYCTKQSIVPIPPFKTRVLDSIGAGDSHCAGLLAALSAGWQIDNAIKFANSLASYVVSHQGGDCAPSRTQLIHYIDSYQTK